jgi:hypothetical protein
MVRAAVSACASKVNNSSHQELDKNNAVANRGCIGPAAAHDDSTSPRAVAAAKPVAPGRTPDGKFAKGNPGGPGNPHARECARILHIMQSGIADEEMLQLTRKLIELGLAGDVGAIKVILAYKIGKPQLAPMPDLLARDGWATILQSAVQAADFLKVMRAPPASMIYGISEVLLPCVEEEHKNMILDAMGGTLDENGSKRGNGNRARSGRNSDKAPTQTAVNGDQSVLNALAEAQAVVNGGLSGHKEPNGKPTPSAVNGKKPKGYRTGRAARILTERLRNGMHGG